MFGMATGGAAKHGLRPTRASVDPSACAACLRAVGGWDLDERAPRPLELVAEHRSEAGPSRIGDAARTVAAHHAGDVELLDHDHAVALGVPVTEDVKEVLALPTDLAVQDGDADLCLFSVLGSFLATGDGTLCVSKPPHGGLVEARGGDEATVRVGDRVDYAAVDGDDGARARGRVRNLDLTDDRGEPLTTGLLLEGAGLSCALEWAVDDGAHGTELREVKRRAVEAPALRVRRANRKNVTTLVLPPWGASELLEAALPSFVQFDKALCGDVARHSSEPRKLGAKIGEFVDLVERSRVALIALGPRQAHAPLLVGKVP